MVPKKLEKTTDYLDLTLIVWMIATQLIITYTLSKILIILSISPH